MTPTETFDPRDAWAHARRMEIYRYALENGVTDFEDSANGIPPKEVMVRRLKSLHIPPPSVPQRPIGAQIDARSGDTSPDSHHFNGQQQKPKAEAATVDADELLERDWQTKPVAELGINELRAECKARDIKMSRRDTMETLRAKLSGK